MKRSSEYDIEANKALIGAYSVVIRYSARNGFTRYDLTSFANDLTVQIRSNMMEELVKENWILKSIGCRTLDVNNLMPAVGKPVKLNDIFEAFLKFDDKPMILGPETVTACANDNCQKGHFNIAQSTDGNVFKNIKHLATMPFLDPTDENYWIIDESIVEKPVETATGVNVGSVAGNGATAPFGGASNDPMSSPTVPSAGQATSTAGADKVFQNIEISGTIDGSKWNQMFSSFINLLRRNNLEIDVKIKAKSTADNPIKESSPTYKSIKESASQMGLDLKVEE